MRRVFIGPNAGGKTRATIELANKFQDEGLVVASNLPEFNSDNLPVDPLKKLALEQSGIYEEINNNYTYVEGIYLNTILEILSKEGQVLILDDVDSHMTISILNDIINLLMVDPEPDDFDPAYPELWRLWEHVILIGYDVILANITSDDYLEREVHYISKDGTETVVVGGDNIERCIRHPI